MSHFSFAPRPRRVSYGALQALDFGLRVRIDARPAQRSLFSGSENLSVQELTSELSERLSWLRVRSFRFRGELERVTEALIVNVDCGFWALAERAALDLADLLGSLHRRRLADPELCVLGQRCALRIADLCGQEVR